MEYHEEFYGQECTSGRVTTDFRRPHRNYTVNSSNSDASDDTSNAHHGDVLGSGLKSGAEQSPKATEDDGLDTPTPIGKRTSNQSSNECTDVVNGHDSTFGSNVSRIACRLGENKVLLGKRRAPFTCNWIDAHLPLI